MPNYSHGTKLALAAADEPPYLTVGTDVSAKYKGAFCEAKIIDVNKNVKVRVLFDGSSGNHLIDDTELKAGSTLEIGAKVEAKHPEKKQQTYIAATITKILDHSRYTVVFDDGDQCILRRSSICLKSGKHFAESETLDQLPLTNPEHFGNPVKVGQATAEQSSNQQNNGHNPHHNNNNNNNNINSSRNNQQAQNDKKSSSNLKLDNNDTVVGKSKNKIVNSDNNSTPTNGRPAATQNNVKLETTDKPSSKTKTTSSNSVTTGAVLSTPGRRGGKGRKAKDSTVNNSKPTDMADDFGDNSQDSAEADGGDSSLNDLIEVGVKLMVQYGKGKIQNVYEAKVNKIETNSAGKTRYFVHYTGWNNRYDEWVTKNRILSIVTDKENGVRDGRSRHSEATNATASSTAASSNSTAKELNQGKEKDVSTPAKGPRRSRLTEAAAAAPVSASASTITPPTTATTTTATTTPTTDVSTPAKGQRRSRLTEAAAAAPVSVSASTIAPPTTATTTTATTTPTTDVPTPAKLPRRSRLAEAAAATSVPVSSSTIKPITPATATPATTTMVTATTVTSQVRPLTPVATPAKEATAAASMPASSSTIKPPTTATTTTVATDVSTSAKLPRRSRLTEATASASVPVSSSTVAPLTPATATTATTTIGTATTATSQVGPLTPVANPAKEATAAASVPVSSSTITQTTMATTTTMATATTTSQAEPLTPVATPARERDKSREIPTKTRRSRHIIDSSANSAATSSASSTSSVVSATAPVVVKDEPNISITFSNNVMSAYNLIEKERFSDLPIIDEPDCDKRISILQDKIMAIKQTYLALRSELADLDRRKKRPRLERSNSDHINFSGVTCRN